MIVKNNFFIEKVLPMFLVRKLSEEEMNKYREPYLEETSRKPVFVWPNEIPIDGHPSDNAEIVERNNAKLKESDIPKLLLWAKPGVIIKKKGRDRIINEFKNVKDVYLGKGKHYLREDHPDKIGSAIVEWFQSLE
jgi:haloalkane dehalogenase